MEYAQSDVLPKVTTKFFAFFYEINMTMLVNFSWLSRNALEQKQISENEVPKCERHADMVSTLLCENKIIQMCLNLHMEMGLSSFNALCIKTCNHCHVTFLLRLDSLCCKNAFYSLQVVWV